MTPVERQVQFMMRAWPIPDRAERGEEIVGTTLDLMPDGASHISIALAVNLVLGGFRARMRNRPPLWRWAYYRAGGRLPARWHRWMLNDLNSPGWRRRIVVSRLVMAVVALGVPFVLINIQLGARADPNTFLTSLAAYSAGMLLFYRYMTRKDRDRQLSRHGYATPQRKAPWPPPPPQATNGYGDPGQHAPSSR